MCFYFKAIPIRCGRRRRQQQRLRTSVLRISVSLLIVTGSWAIQFRQLLNSPSVLLIRPLLMALNLARGFREILSPLLGTRLGERPNNCAEWMEIYLKLIYRETHLNLFLIRIKIQLLVISFGGSHSPPAQLPASVPPGTLPLPSPFCAPSVDDGTFVWNEGV